MMYSVVRAMKLVDMSKSKSLAFGRGCSSPLTGASSQCYKPSRFVDYHYISEEKLYLVESKTA